MSDDFSDSDPLAELNFPQYWAAVVSQFNAALQIEQDGQRRFYEERFDRIRDEAKHQMDQLKLKQAALVDQYCGSYNELQQRLDDMETATKKMAQLRLNLAAETEKKAKLTKMHQKSIQNEQNSEQILIDQKRILEARLGELVAEKTELKEQISDLKGFFKIQKTLKNHQVDPNSSIFTATKHKK